MEHFIKKFVNIFLGFFVLSLAVSCKKDIPPHGGTTHHSVVELEEDDTEKYIEDMFCDVEVIPLENKRGCMLGNVMKMVVEGEHMYMWDMNGSQTLLSFNMDGSFNCKVGEVGHSKSEYTDMDNFSVNSNGDSIILLDYSTLKIYNDKGKFIGSEELDGTWKQLLFSTKGVVLGSHYRGRENLLQIRDLRTGDVKDLLPVDSAYVSYPLYSENSIQQVGDTVCFFDFLSHIFYIYDVNEPDSAESIQLYTDKILTVEKAKKDLKMNDFGDDLVESFVYNGKEIIGTMNLNESTHNFVLDVKEKKARSFKFRNGYCNFDCYHDGYYYKIMPSGHLLDTYKYYKERNKSGINPIPVGEVYRKLFDLVEKGLSERDNFVVIRMKLKR